MPVILDITKAGSTLPLEKKLLRLRSRSSKGANSIMNSKIENSRLANVSTLYKNINTQAKEVYAQEDQEIKDVASILIKKRGKQIGTIDGKYKSKDGALRGFTTGTDNHVVIHFPEVSKSKALVIRPKPGDLTVKRDGRTKNTWNIGLTDKAVTRFRKELERAVYASTVSTLNKTMFGTGTSGVTLKISSRLGVAADSITLSGNSNSIVGTDLTQLVRQEVQKRMSKTGKADDVLNYRTGGFVNSIKAKVKNRGLITYTFNTKLYGIQEKAKGNSPKGREYTRIEAKNDGVLSFIDKKTGNRVVTKFVDVRERPVIKQSIRSVAMKLFNKRFRMGLE